MAGLNAARDGLVRQRLTEAIEAKQRMLTGPCVAQAVELAGRIVDCLRGGGKVLFFGNGGSATDAGHLAGELMGRFYRDRPALAAVALPDATASVTAIGNDYAYADVFARQLSGLAGPGDVAVGLTTSGNSENVLRACRTARQRGIFTAVLTGAAGGRVLEAADLCIQVPTDDTPRVQEACLHLGHTVCELVEREMFPAG